jgi:pimeloyl-ACP methyl ester carboxylesterase
MRIRIAILVLPLALLVPAQASIAAPDPAPCADLPQLPRAQCGSIQVPLHRAAPSLGTTEVAFALVPRRDSARPSLGTIVPNPGGPGAAVIGTSGPNYARGLAPLLARRDLLLIDPRGTGRSGALACPSYSGAELAFASRGTLVARVGACGRELGDRARLHGTAAVADDVDAVRAALGVERLDLLGESYGSYLWTVYVARHPERVRSLVLSGAYPIDFDPWGRDRLRAFRRAIQLVCARARACRGEAVLRGIARLATRLRRRPISYRVTAGRLHARARLDETALAALLWAGGSADAYAEIPAAVASALGGDLAPLRRFHESGLLSLAAGLAEPDPTQHSFAQSHATQCHDYPRVFSYSDPPPVRRQVYDRALAALDRRAFWPFSPHAWTGAGFEAVDTCLEWPSDPTAGSPLAADTPLPDVPGLVLSGDLDSNTPSEAGRRAAAQFPRAVFVEIPNAGHTPTSEPCALRRIVRFIASLRASRRRCRRAGAPLPLASPAPRRATELPRVRGRLRAVERTALALVVATAADVLEQAAIVESYGDARALRGGRYVARPNGAVRLVGARVVRDARVTGALRPAGDRLRGRLRLSGPGVASAQLRVRLGQRGRGRARGTIAGRRVNVVFRW